MQEKQKVSVIGLGYVGLPTCIAIAKAGLYDVVGYDLDKSKIKLLNKGVSYIDETDVVENLKKGKCLFTDNVSKIKGSKYFIICVPTPVTHDHQPDYSFVLSAAGLVAKYLNPGCHVVIESTVNPGTCEELVLPVLSKNTKLIAGVDYNLAHCPERINPGDKKWNVYNINRNVGSLSEKFSTELVNFYKSFVKDAIVNPVSTIKVAEATKIIENTFRDINIAFVNELAMSFDAMGIDVVETIKAASNKPFAFMPHWPGRGVGGHCIAVDPYYLIERAALSGFDHKLIKLAREVNNSMPIYMVKRMEQAIKEIDLDKANVKVALLGLSYKPNVADDRESPSYDVLGELIRKKYKVVTCDPFVKKADYGKFSDMPADVNVLMVCTPHIVLLNEIKEKLKNKTSVKILVDGMNSIEDLGWTKMGIIYKGIGR